MRPKPAARTASRRICSAHWKQEFIERAPELFKTKHERSAEEARIAELERLVGQLTLELSAAKKVSSLLNSRSSNGGKS